MAQRSPKRHARRKHHRSQRHALRNPARGSGFFSAIRDRFTATAKTFSSYSPKVESWLKQHGSEPITGLSVYRAPLDSMVKSALGWLSQGKLQQEMASRGHDTIFHVGLVVQTATAHVLLEKTHAISINPVPMNPKQQLVRIDNVPPSLTTNMLLQRWRDRQGDKLFFSYDPFNNNCQVFIRGLLSSSGMYTEDINKFLFQDVDGLAKSLGGFTSTIMRALPRIAAPVARFFTGGSLYNVVGSTAVDPVGIESSYVKSVHGGALSQAADVAEGGALRRIKRGARSSTRLGGPRRSSKSSRRRVRMTMRFQLPAFRRAAMVNADKLSLMQGQAQAAAYDLSEVQDLVRILQKEGNQQYLRNYQDYQRRNNLVPGNPTDTLLLRNKASELVMLAEKRLATNLKIAETLGEFSAINSVKRAGALAFFNQERNNTRAVAAGDALSAENTRVTIDQQREADDEIDRWLQNYDFSTSGAQGAATRLDDERSALERNRIGNPTLDSRFRQNLSQFASTPYPPRPTERRQAAGVNKAATGANAAANYGTMTPNTAQGELTRLGNPAQGMADARKEAESKLDQPTGTADSPFTQGVKSTPKTLINALLQTNQSTTDPTTPGNNLQQPILATPEGVATGITTAINDQTAKLPYPSPPDSAPGRRVPVSPTGRVVIGGPMGELSLVDDAADEIQEGDVNLTDQPPTPGGTGSGLRFSSRRGASRSKKSTKRRGGFFFGLLKPTTFGAAVKSTGFFSKIGKALGSAGSTIAERIIKPVLSQHIESEARKLTQSGGSLSSKRSALKSVLGSRKYERCVQSVKRHMGKTHAKNPYAICTAALLHSKTKHHHRKLLKELHGAGFGSFLKKVGRAIARGTEGALNLTRSALNTAKDVSNIKSAIKGVRGATSFSDFAGRALGALETAHSSDLFAGLRGGRM